MTNAALLSSGPRVADRHTHTARNDRRDRGRRAPVASAPPRHGDLSRTRGIVEAVATDLIAIRLQDGSLVTYALVGELDCTTGPGFTAVNRFAGLQPGDVVAVTTCDAPDDLHTALRRRTAN